MKFKPEMFDEGGIGFANLTPHLAADCAQHAFDEWVEKQQTVHATACDVGLGPWVQSGSDNGATHKAKLIYVEKIERPECTQHIPTTYAKNVMSRGSALDFLAGCGIKCLKCGVHLKPNGWIPD